MKLLSHGEGSDLLTHLCEVAAGAADPRERAILLCHDIGKATKEWQRYIRRPLAGGSPHPHAAAGGLLAACLLKRARATPQQVLVALESAAAHHSGLSIVGETLLASVEIITQDEQAKAFFLDRVEGVASQLPEYCDELLQQTWSDFQHSANLLSPQRAELCAFCGRLADGARLTAYFAARELLGKLCFRDHASAARQSGRSTGVADYDEAFAALPFRPRQARELASGGAINELRTRLRREFLETAKQDGVFYFLDAPTGMGKTEAMLSAAELLRGRRNAEKIVFAVPQISIADQIFEDYLKQSPSAQIWDFRRHENTGAVISESGNLDDTGQLAAEEHPFAASYNVTTFNQVLLTMCHPDRARCIRVAGLRHAIIVMDEFHKLPLILLPLFFRAAREYAMRCDCCFVLGSATPFQPFPYWGIEDAIRIPETVTGPLYRDIALNGRRSYRSVGRLTVDGLNAAIDEFHRDHPAKNLLVVVNLVGAGSWPLRRKRTGGYMPWRELQQLESMDTGRAEIVLDGLTPPALRRRIVCEAAAIIKSRRRPLTMITTQMIEVGVDLDFDAALCDYQGVASIIQRGGRVGREGRSDASLITVFSLELDKDRTSFELLNAEEAKDARGRLDVFGEAAELTAELRRQEARFFRKWQADERFSDADLTDKMREFQQQVFGQSKPQTKWWSRLFAADPRNMSPGLSFEYAHYLAELSGEDYGEEAVVVDRVEIAERLCRLDAKISGNTSTADERSEYRRLLADYKISFRRGLSVELGLTGQYCILRNPYPLAVYQLAAQIW